MKWILKNCNENVLLAQVKSARMGTATRSDAASTGRPMISTAETWDKSRSRRSTWSSECLLTTTASTPTTAVFLCFVFACRAFRRQDYVWLLRYVMHGWWDHDGWFIVDDQWLMTYDGWCYRLVGIYTRGVRLGSMTPACGSAHAHIAHEKYIYI